VLLKIPSETRFFKIQVFDRVKSFSLVIELPNCLPVGELPIVDEAVAELIA